MVDETRASEPRISRPEMRPPGVIARPGRMLRDRVRVTSELVAGILHEFNSPLGALRSSIDSAHSGVARLIENIELDPAAARSLATQLQEILGTARAAVDRIVDSVETLSHFARVDRADVDVVDICQVVETALRLSGATRDRRIRIVRRTPGPLTVRCRVREIEHVLFHVLRNANEALASAVSPCIEIAIERDGERITISVQDSGPGIDSTALPTLFEPSLGTKKGATIGLELSLATCQSIAQDHGGALLAENIPGRGARFTLQFREERMGH